MAIPRLFLVAAMLVACSGRERPMPGTSDTASTKAVASDARAPGTLTLPSGFSATVFADSLGGARHVVTAANGDVYVNTWLAVRLDPRRAPRRLPRRPA